MGRIVVRRDEAHTLPAAGPSDPGDQSGSSARPDDDWCGLDARVAGIVGAGRHVLILGDETGLLCSALEECGCQTARATPASLPEHEAGGLYDAIVVADLVGRRVDPVALLAQLRGQLRAEGSLIVTLRRIAPVAGRLAVLDGGPLGAGSGVLFSEQGLLALLEAARFAVVHIERVASDPDRDVLDGGDNACKNPVTQDWLVVAFPLPSAELSAIQARTRTLAQQLEPLVREAALLRREAAQAEHRQRVLEGHQRRMAERITDLRAQLLAAHDQMICRDDEIRKTFGDAIFLRNSLLIERDTLLAQREALAAQRAALSSERDALLEERQALQDRLHHAERRLQLLRSGPLGLVLRVYRKLMPRRGGGPAH